MPSSELLVLVVQARELLLAVLVSHLERSVAGNTCLLRELLVCLVELGTLILGLSELRLGLLEFLVEISELLQVALVLSLDELQLLTGMREHDNVVDDLTAETGKLFVTLLNLLVEGLVLNLELLIIDQVKTLGKLLLLLQDFLLVLKTIAKSDVL